MCHYSVNVRFHIGLFLSSGDYGHWTKCHGMFINTIKQRFCVVKKNAMAKSPVVQNPRLTRIKHGSPIQEFKYAAK